MKNQSFHIILRVLAIMVGVVLTLNALLVTFVSNFNLGAVCTWIAGLFFVSVGMFYNFVRFKVHISIKCIFAVGLAIVVGVVSFVYLYGNNDTITNDEDAIIVLGAGVHGETMSATLRHRVDVAIEVYNKNPDVVIVVSGGQGPQEDITEALAMERYLILNGVPKERIIKEERSTSTAENFRFSKAILDEHFNREYKVAFVTDNFHVYRAEIKAKIEGYSNVTHCHSVGLFYTAIPNGFREFLAVMYEWVFK